MNNKQFNLMKVHSPILEPDLDLGIFQTKIVGQFLAVRLRDVLLCLKPLLQTLPLGIAEHGPSHHASSWLTSGRAHPGQRA